MWLEQLWNVDIHEPQLAQFLSAEETVRHSEEEFNVARRWRCA